MKPIQRFNLAEGITTEQLQVVCHLAKEQCYEWWADVLDCSVSMRRQKLDWTFGQIMERCDDNCEPIVIHREYAWDDYWEVGFYTNSVGPIYFLWILVKPDQIQPVLNYLERIKQ